MNEYDIVISKMSRRLVSGGCSSSARRRRSRGFRGSAFFERFDRKLGFGSGVPERVCVIEHGRIHRHLVHSGRRERQQKLRREIVVVRFDRLAQAHSAIHQLNSFIKKTTKNQLMLILIVV